MPLPSPTDDITRGLNQRPASISPKYFYDQRGSLLFEAITRVKHRSFDARINAIAADKGRPAALRMRWRTRARDTCPARNSS